MSAEKGHPELDDGELAPPPPPPPWPGSAAAPEAAEQAGVKQDAGEQAGHDPEEAGDGHDGDVAVGDVGELVGQDRLELGLVQTAQDARRHTDDGVLLVATGGEGVRHVDVRDRHLGLGHVGERAETVDHGVELGSLLAA